MVQILSKRQLRRCRVKNLKRRELKKLFCFGEQIAKTHQDVLINLLGTVYKVTAEKSTFLGEENLCIKTHAMKVENSRLVEDIGSYQYTSIKRTGWKYEAGKTTHTLKGREIVSLMEAVDPDVVTL